jgi:aspartate/methionine/tyrosine aminotransferase
MFAKRTNWNLAPNRFTVALEKHRAAGRELLDLTASNPTEVGIRYDGLSILKALVDLRALEYRPEPKGMLRAREAVAQYYRERAGDEVGPENIILTTSTSEAYTYVFRLLCEPGDEVLVPAPSYPLFEFLAGLQDVRLAPYELVYDHGWQIDSHSLEKALSPRSRAVLVVHPNNPTGAYVKPAEAAALNELCAGRRLAIVADEVFLDYAHDAAARPSFAQNRDALTFTLSGLSKISGMPQMKFAWIAVSGPRELAQEALARLEVIADTYLSINAPIQLASPELFRQRLSFQADLLARIRANLAELDAQLAQQKAVCRLDVEGGWYAVLRVPVTRTDEALAIELLERTGVLLHPGHFYDFHSDGYLIVSLITPAAAFAEGLRRVLAFF